MARPSVRKVQRPAGKGYGRKRRLLGNRGDRADNGDTQPERVLTSRWSRKKEERKTRKMTDTIGQEIASDGHHRPTDWVQIDWRKAERTVRSLRFRIFRAAQQQNWKKVKSLTRLMLRGYSNRLVSTRRVTQVNQGKNTPGIDGKVADTPERRGKLVDELRDYRPWQASPVKRTYIPKANGKVRPLGIPTIKDRVLQAMVKNALEPRFETEFETNSYGFRPGRCTQDAMEEIHAALNESAVGRNQYILDADIKGAFDHISHEFVLNRIGKMPGRELVRQWLKAGYVEWGTLHQTIEGTPQGGVISPLLANIALDGLQSLLGKGYRMARYADDFVVMAKSQSAIEQAIPRIEAFLRERGLELNQEKTRIIHRTKGFEFLGFSVRMYERKLLTKPQKEKVQDLLGRIKTWLEANKTAKTEEVIRYLNPILRGWAYYYRHAASKQVFQVVDHRLWWMLWRWAKRRHPKKGKRWIFHRYFHHNTLYADTRDRWGKKARIHLVRVSETPITRHVKVKGKASPDDPSLAQYWEQRCIRLGSARVARGSKLHKVAESQGWKCPSCGIALFNGEPLDVHHIIPIKQGGTDAEDNLQWSHEACHYQRHQQKRRASCQVA